MQFNHWVTTPEEVDQIICSFLHSSRRCNTKSRYNQTSSLCFISVRPQPNFTGIAASPHRQTVPGTSTQPAKPSRVQSQPWGCVCVRPCLPLPESILLCSSPALPVSLVPRAPKLFFFFFFLPWCDWVLRLLFLVSGSETICVLEVFPTSQQLFPALDLKDVLLSVSCWCLSLTFSGWLTFSHVSPYALILCPFMSSLLNPPSSSSSHCLLLD